MHKVNFVIGESVFIPRIYNTGEHTEAVILSVGRKYAKAVHKNLYGTEDQKEMTFNIELDTLQTKVTGSHIRTVYQSAEQYKNIIDEQNKQATRFKALKETKWQDLDSDKLEQVYAILGI